MNLLIDAYHDRLLMEVGTEVEDVSNWEIANEFESVALYHARWKLTGETRCWDCGETVIHTDDSKCPKCGAEEIPF